jgi:hypothetical protein
MPKASGKPVTVMLHGSVGVQPAAHEQEEFQ